MDLNALDAKIYLLINHGTVNGLFDVIMPFLSNKGFMLAFPFGAFMIWQAYRQPAEKRRETMLLAIWTIAIAVLSFLLADWLGNELKHYVRRVRPCHVIEGARLLGGCSDSYSMPSNHSINSFAYAVPLFFMTRAYIGRIWRFYPLILAAAVAYSRVYLGVHYPGDITVGAILGSLSAALNMTFFRIVSAKYKERPFTTLLYSALFIIAIFRIYYLLRGKLDLSPVEAGYWQMAGGGMSSMALSASPVVVWLIGISTSIFGDTMFGVRIFALVLSLLSSYIMFGLARDIYRDEAVALVSALMVQAIPAFAMSGIIMSPGSPIVFFWILSLWLFHTGVHEDHASETPSKNGLSASWIMLGISMGLGLLTSPAMALFAVAMYLFLAISDNKKLLTTIKPHASVLVSALVFAAGTAMAGMKTTVLSAQASSMYQSMTALSVWHLLMITPLVLGLIFFSLHKLFYNGKGGESRFLFAFSIPVIALSLICRIAFDIETGLIITGYITGTIALARYFFGTDISRADTGKVINTKRVIVGVGIASAIFVSAFLHFPMMLKMPASVDPTLERWGWRDLGSKVSAITDQHDKGALPVIFSDDCRIAGELEFYTTGHPKTYCKGPVSRYASKGSDAIVVAAGNTEPPESERSLFSHTDRTAVKIAYKGRELKAYSIFICYNAKGPKTGPTER